MTLPANTTTLKSLYFVQNPTEITLASNFTRARCQTFTYSVERFSLLLFAVSSNMKTY